MEVVDGQYWPQGFSWFWVGVVSASVLVTLGIAIFLARKHALAARRARIAMEKKVGLFAGNAIVMGVTETDDEAPAIRVEIHQQGRETRQKNGYSHTWTEFDRKQTTRPFRVRVPGGTVVHVEPAKEVFLVDDLEVMKRTEREFRVMHAELSHGETVTIEGTLERVLRPSNNGEGDYRGNQEVWLLRPPSRGHMLVSTEPLPQRHEKRATFWWLSAAALSLFFVVVHGALFATGFWPLVMHHECSSVQVESHRHWTTRARRSTTHHTSIVGSVVDGCDGAEAGTPIGTHIEEEISGNYADGARVPFQFERGNPRVFRLGTGVGLSSTEWWVLTIASLVLFGFGYSRFRASLPWYETKLKQTYPGRLE